MPEKVFVDRVEVTTTTIDVWAAEAAVNRVDLLWLDMQGMELPVLRAAPVTLAGVVAICMEVSVRELYAGNALYSEVRPFLEQHGFEAVIERVPRYSGNVLFVRQQ